MSASRFEPRRTLPVACALLAACASSPPPAPTTGATPPACAVLPARGPSIAALPWLGYSPHLVETGSNGERYVVAGGVRAVLRGEQTEVALDGFADDIEQVVRVERGWVFVTHEGVAARADSFTGPLTVLGESGPRADTRRGIPGLRVDLGRGRAVMAEGDARFESTDGSGPWTPMAGIPRPTREVDFFDAQRGVAYTDDRRVFYTRDGGATFTELSLAGPANAPRPTAEGWVVTVRDPSGATSDVQVTAAGEVSTAAGHALELPTEAPALRDDGTGARVREALAARWPEASTALELGSTPGGGLAGAGANGVVVTLAPRGGAWRLVSRALADGQVLSDEAVTLPGAACEVRRWGATAAMALCDAGDGQEVFRVTWNAGGGGARATHVVSLPDRRGAVPSADGRRAVWQGECHDPEAADVARGPEGSIPLCVWSLPSGVGEPERRSVRVGGNTPGLRAIAGDTAVVTSRRSFHTSTPPRPGFLRLDTGAFAWVEPWQAGDRAVQPRVASVSLDGSTLVVVGDAEPGAPKPVRLGPSPDALRDATLPPGFESIEMLDAHRGVAVPDHAAGEPWITVDGGAHWSPAESVDASAATAPAVQRVQGGHGGAWLVRWDGPLQRQPVIARGTPSTREAHAEDHALGCRALPPPANTPAAPREPRMPGPANSFRAFASAGDTLLGISTWPSTGPRARTQWTWWGRDARGAFSATTAPWSWDRPPGHTTNGENFTVLALGRAGAMLNYCGPALAGVPWANEAGRSTASVVADAPDENPCGLVWLAPGRPPARVAEPALPRLVSILPRGDSLDAAVLGLLTPDGGAAVRTQVSLFPNVDSAANVDVGPDLRVRGLSFSGTAVGTDGSGRVVFGALTRDPPDDQWFVRALRAPGETVFRDTEPMHACVGAAPANAVRVQVEREVRDTGLGPDVLTPDAPSGWTATVELSASGSCLRALTVSNATPVRREVLRAGHAEAMPDGTLSGTLHVGARSLALECRP